MYRIQDMTRRDPRQLERRFGEQVRRVRTDLGISQVELARLANVSRSAIVNLESGAGSSLATVTKVLDALGQGEWLLTLVPPPTTFNPLDLLDAGDPRAARPRRRS
jgi:transcriptional regulator with XRE-family HTH domain